MSVIMVSAALASYVILGTGKELGIPCLCQFLADGRLDRWR